MHPAVASVVFTLVILGLFWIDRDRKARTSEALWIVVVWFSLASSRSVGQWLQVGTSGAFLESSDQIQEGSPLDRFAYTILIALGLAVLVKRRMQVVAVLQANGSIIVFFVYCLVSLLWSEYPDVAFKRWTKAIGDFVMVLIVLSDREPLIAVRRLIARVSYVLIPLSILFIKYYSDLGRGYGRWDGTLYYIGVTTNKNALGAISLCFGLGALWRMVHTCQTWGGNSRSRELIAPAAILAMSSWLLFTVNSMTSLACFIQASAIILAVNFNSTIRRPAPLYLLVAAMVTISFSVLFLGVSQSAFELMGRSQNLTDRTDIWSLLLTLVPEPLLGAGFESFWLGRRLDKIWSIYSWQPMEAHNGYLEVFLNLGWIGVALLAVVIVKGYRTTVTACCRNLPASDLMLAYFIVGMVYNFTEAAFFRMMTPVWLFFLLAIASVSEFPRRRIRALQENTVQHYCAANIPASTAKTGAVVEAP